MRLHRFYIKDRIEGDEMTISEERLINQWKNVFRYSKGDRVVIFDGKGKEFETEIENIDKKEAVLKIKEEKDGIIPSKNIVLYQSLIKKDNMEWIVEKATELGVSKIVPLISERSEKKGFNIERANKIAIEAAEQCGRGNIPEISGIMNIEEGILENPENLIVFDKSGSSFDYSLFTTHSSFSIFIGPEGGWTENELELFKNKNAKILSLGTFTLRAETASIAALSRLGGL